MSRMINPWDGDRMGTWILVYLLTKPFTLFFVLLGCLRHPRFIMPTGLRNNICRMIPISLGITCQQCYSINVVFNQLTCARITPNRNGDWPQAAGVHPPNTVCNWYTTKQCWSSKRFNIYTYIYIYIVAFSVTNQSWSSKRFYKYIYISIYTHIHE